MKMLILRHSGCLPRLPCTFVHRRGLCPFVHGGKPFNSIFPEATKPSNVFTWITATLIQAKSLQKLEQWSFFSSFYQFNVPLNTQERWSTSSFVTAGIFLTHLGGKNTFPSISPVLLVLTVAPFFLLALSAVSRRSSSREQGVPAPCIPELSCAVKKEWHILWENLVLMCLQICFLQKN